MENHINKLSPRKLSLYGKKILLNTLIMSKTLYLSNVFPLDAKTTLKIHKKNIQIPLAQPKIKPYSQENNLPIKKKQTKSLRTWSS